MKNIFDVLPDNFFNILTRNNNKIMSDCILTLFNNLQDALNFSIMKEEVVECLIEYFDNHIVELNVEEENIKTSREKSTYVLQRLKECGWIEQSVGENYLPQITFEDYSIEIITSFHNMLDDYDVEYIGYIYGICEDLNRFDITHGDIVLERVYSNTKILMNKLKSLNANIKKYAQKIVDDTIKNDLNKLLDSLLIDYQSQIIDRAYYNLTTKDNPSKYQTSILDNMNQITSNEDFEEKIIRLIMDRKAIDFKEADKVYNNQKRYIINAFENMEDIIEEIDFKNRKYIESVKNRIIFLLNNNSDIEGRISTILKAVENGFDINNQIYFLSNGYYNKESLFTPRKAPVKIKTTIEEYEEDNEAIEQFHEKLRYNKQFSLVAIQNKVLQTIGKGKEITAQDLHINEVNDYTKLVLSYIYGYKDESKYTIEPLNQYITIGKYTFKNFKMIKKESSDE